MGGDENLTWLGLADYAEFLSMLTRTQRSLATSPDAARNLEKMMDFMAANGTEGKA